MKIYMIVLDGAADRKIDVLGNRTPLEKAYTPALDSLAQNGQSGLVTVIDDMITPESDSGSMALLSYDPKIYYPGRGTLEGIGTGFIPDGYNYAAFRINFASYDSKNKKLDRRTARGLSDEELQKISKSILEEVDLSKFNVKFNLIAFGHHRGIVCFYSKEHKLSGNVTNTDPGFKKEGVWGIPIKNYENYPLECKPIDDTKDAQLTAEIVNEFVFQTNKILENHPINKKRLEKGEMLANYIILRDGGEKPKKMPSFYEKFNLSLSMYGQLPAENAIANLIGEKFYYSKSLDLQLDKEFLMGIEKKLVQDKSDVVFAHIKGPDEPGHDNEPLKKVEAIEKIDKYFIKNLKKDIDQDDIVVITCDHATPCEMKIHSKDKVPALIFGKYFLKDESKRFDESNAQIGNLKINNSIQILPYIIDKWRSQNENNNN